MEINNSLSGLDELLNHFEKTYGNAIQDFSRDAVIVNKFKEVIWNDSSLGFPSSGKFYAQVLTPGYECELNVNGTRFVIHTDKDLKNVVVIRPDRFIDSAEDAAAWMKTMKPAKG